MVSRVTSIAQGDQVSRIITATRGARDEVMYVCLTPWACSSTPLTGIAVSGENYRPSGSPSLS